MKAKCAKCFKVIGTPARLTIFMAIVDGKKYDVSDLVKMTGLKQPTVTFHLNQLAKAGLVKKTKEGRNVYTTVTKLCDGCPLV